jgi:phospholipid/cholesterol/gamma-HCH transport system substrate-binding protein
MLNTHAGALDHLTRNLDQVTHELRAGDGDVRALLAKGPTFSTTTTQFLDQLGRQLPGLLGVANPVLRTLSVYNPALEQLLSDFPMALSIVQSVTLGSGSESMVRLTLANIMDPPECTKGFLPVSRWTSPLDVRPRRTPLVYCDEPRSDPRDVRGVRNVPCPLNPARREADASRC